MIIVRHKIDAAGSAILCGRLLFVRGLALSLLVCAAVPAAVAGPGEREGQPRMQERREQLRQAPVQPPAAQPQQRQNEPLRNDMRQFDQRAEEQRRMQQLQQEQNGNNQDAARRGGRLTPDERRDLRRQINEAGMDLYANPKRR